MSRRNRARAYRSVESDESGDDSDDESDASNASNVLAEGAIKPRPKRKTTSHQVYNYYGPVTTVSTGKNTGTNTDTNTDKKKSESLGSLKPLITNPTTATTTTDENTPPRSPPMPSNGSNGTPISESFFENGNIWKLSETGCKTYKEGVGALVSLAASAATGLANGAMTAASTTGSFFSRSNVYNSGMCYEQEVNINTPYRFSDLIGVSGYKKDALKVMYTRSKRYADNTPRHSEKYKPVLGTPVLGTYIDNPENDAKANDSIRIISFNTNKFFNDVDHHGDENTEMVVQMEEQITWILEQNPDIICLQNMVPTVPTDGNIRPNEPKSNFVDLQKLLYKYNMFITDTSYDLSMVEEYRLVCNGIFTRKQMIKKESIELGNNTILQMVAIDCDKYTITILNIDLKDDPNIKKTQFKKIRDYISSVERLLTKKPNFIILTGDFGMKHPLKSTVDSSDDSDSVPHLLNADGTLEGEELSEKPVLPKKGDTSDNKTDKEYFASINMSYNPSTVNANEENNFFLTKTLSRDFGYNTEFRVLNRNIGMFRSYPVQYDFYISDSPKPKFSIFPKNVFGKRLTNKKEALLIAEEDYNRARNEFDEFDFNTLSGGGPTDVIQNLKDARHTYAISTTMPKIYSEYATNVVNPFVRDRYIAEYEKKKEEVYVFELELYDDEEENNPVGKRPQPTPLPPPPPGPGSSGPAPAGSSGPAPAGPLGLPLGQSSPPASGPAPAGSSNRWFGLSAPRFSLRSTRKQTSQSSNTQSLQQARPSHRTLTKINTDIDTKKNSIDQVKNDIALLIRQRKSDGAIDRRKRRLQQLQGELNELMFELTNNPEHDGAVGGQKTKRKRTRRNTVYRCRSRKRRTRRIK